MKNNKFFEILSWAFKQKDGFQESELIKKFSLDQNWYLKTFRPSIKENENLVMHLRYDDKDTKHYHMLSEKGISKFFDLNKPWHEKFIGKVILILIGATAGIILKAFWDYLITN